MTVQNALTLLKNAILNVNSDYIYGVNWEDIQVERCFAYELYHQWSKLLNLYKISHPKEGPLYINGEVPKDVDVREKLYPDMVLHSGQSNEVEQVLACEIKRASVSNAYYILKDIYKLLKYLDFYKKGESDIHIEYGSSVFIMVGCTLEKMVQCIQQSIYKKVDTFPEKHQEDVKDYLNFIKNSDNYKKVLCISVESKNNENAIEFCQLDDILEKSKIFNY